jgi:hypothetical protein
VAKNKRVYGGADTFTQLRVTGGGSANPPTVRIPGVYQANHPGIQVNSTWPQCNADMCDRLLTAVKSQFMIALVSLTRHLTRSPDPRRSRARRKLRKYYGGTKRFSQIQAKWMIYPPLDNFPPESNQVRRLDCIEGISVAIPIDFSCLIASFVRQFGTVNHGLLGCKAS